MPASLAIRRAIRSVCGGEVATGGAEGQDRRTWQEVIERFLFDRVDAKARRPATGGEHHLVAVPAAHEAETALPFLQMNSAIREDVPVAPRFSLDVLIHNAVGLILRNKPRNGDEVRAEQYAAGGGAILENPSPGGRCVGHRIAPDQLVRPVDVEARLNG